MRKANFECVAKETAKLKIPRPMKPPLKMRVAGKRSDKRPAKRRKAEKHSEYEVMLCSRLVNGLKRLLYTTYPYYL
jgi:hypothetical protein